MMNEAFVENSPKHVTLSHSENIAALDGSSVTELSPQLLLLFSQPKINPLLKGSRGQILDAVHLKQPHYIPKLEIMDEMVRRAKKYLPSLEKIAFIGAQHKLETTATLFQSMIELGANPKNMFFTGKSYSTCPAVEATIRGLGVRIFDDPKPLYPGGYSEACTKVIKAMWEEFEEHLKKTPNIEKIIILDDGARVVEELKFTTAISYPLVIIEQTRGGLYSAGLTDHGVFPMISVAQCATKKIIEAPLIATAILTRLEKVVQNLNIDREIFGVVGNGSTGKMVANYLTEMGYKVIVYDQIITIKNHSSIIMANNIEEIFKNCSVIFGCTGRDITEKLDLKSIVTRDQIWISGSSEDREFKSFLVTNKDLFYDDDDILYYLPNGKKITIKQGGFPFNFDKEPWNVSAPDIEVTQCCLLGGILQAAVIELNCKSKYKIESQQQLNPYIQSFIVTTWGDRELATAENSRFEKNLIDMFKVISWIEGKSGKCENFDNQMLKTAFPISVDLNALPVEQQTLDMCKFMKKSPGVSLKL